MNIQAIRQYDLVKSLKNNDTKNQPVVDVATKPVESDSVSFKGGKEADWISKFFGKNYAFKLANKDWVHNLSKRLAKVPGSVTEHMATLGSFITSSVYMSRTLSNKNLDSDKKRTLSINQFLCFIIPTICAYFVNYKIAGKTKQLERRYAGLMKQEMALGNITGGKLKNLESNFGNKLKGFKTLTSLATFTLIYRYITPVAITPAANSIGELVNKKHKEKVAEKSCDAQLVKA